MIKVKKNIFYLLLIILVLTGTQSSFAQNTSYLDQDLNLSYNISYISSKVDNSKITISKETNKTIEPIYYSNFAYKTKKDSYNSLSIITQTFLLYGKIIQDI